MSKSTLMKLGAVALIAVIVVVTGSQLGKNKDETQKTVGILQIVEHPALDSARKGFIDRLAEKGYKDGENIKIEYLNAQGDQSNLKTMSQSLVSKKADIVLAIATPSAQSIANETKEIPILTTAVTDLVSAKLIKSNDKPETNVSGTSDMTPIADQLKLIKQLVPNAKTIGLFYNSSEVNSKLQVDIAEKAAKEMGYSTEKMTVTNTNDVEQNMQVLASKVDVIYIPTDNTLASAMATVGKISISEKVPVITGEENMCKTGGIATVGIDYIKLGQQTADMAIEILEGKKKIEDMPVEFQTSPKIYVNKDMCQKLGITIPKELENAQ